MIKSNIKSNFFSLLLLALFIFFYILFSLIPVNAAITVISPANYTNNTGTAIFNVSYINGTDFTDAKNATFYYNLSGTWTVIGSTTACSNGATFASCNATLNISSLTDGIYNINATLKNDTNSFNATIIHYGIIFDSKAPNVTSYSNTVNKGNYSGTILLNVSCVDNVIGVNNVYFNITYPNGTQLNFTRASNPSGTDYNISLITTGFLDGNYNITAFANDTLNNLNRSERIQVTFDNTPPNVSSFSNTVNTGNYSGTIVLNATISDKTLDISNVYFNITYPNGTQLNFTKSSNPSGTDYNISLITTGFLDGNYNITAFANDTLNNLNRSERIQVTFDNTPPNVSNFTNTVNNGNYSGSIILNTTVDDVTTSVNNVYFNITYPNGTQLNFTQASKSGITYNLTVSTSVFTDGLYNITVYANDSANSRNNSKFIQVRFDNTNPSATMSCTPATVVSGNTVTCTCSPSDGGSGIDSSLTVYTANPSTSSTGTFTQTCTFKDLAGNSGSASDTYTVELSGGGGGGGGGGSGGATTTSFYTKTIPKSGEEFSVIQFIDQELKVKERIKIKINSEIHYIGVRELTSTSATIEITSIPVQVKLNIGEDTKVDINDDKFYDVYVKLNSISSNKADLTINYLHEAIPEETVEEPEIVEEPPALAPPEEKQPILEEKKSLLWLWITIGVVIVIIVLFLIYKKRYL